MAENSCPICPVIVPESDFIEVQRTDRHSGSGQTDTVGLSVQRLILNSETPGPQKSTAPSAPRNSSKHCPWGLSRRRERVYLPEAGEPVWTFSAPSRFPAWPGGPRGGASRAPPTGSQSLPAPTVPTAGFSEHQYRVWSSVTGSHTFGKNQEQPFQLCQGQFLL